MQPAPLLRALRRLSPARLRSAWLARGSPASSTLPVDDDAAVVAIKVGASCGAVRLERRAGSARLHLTQALAAPASQLRAWKASGLIDNARVVLVLDSTDRHFLMLDQPELPPEELPLAARYPLAEAMDMEADHLLATATVMPQINDALKPQMLAVGAPLQTVREQLALLTAAGITVRHIDIADSALRGMVLLQGQAEEGCVALALVGGDICIGLIWLHQFCALRALTLPPQSTREDGEFEEQLALQIQRTADYFERQATRLSVRSVLACMPSLPEETTRSVLSALPLPSRTFELAKALDLNAEAAHACTGNNELHALVGVAAARLLEPLAERALAQAQERQAQAEQASKLTDNQAAYAPLTMTPAATPANPATVQASEAGLLRAPTPAELSQDALGQIALESRQQNETLRNAETAALQLEDRA